MQSSVLTLNNQIENLCHKKCDDSIVSENIPVNHCNLSMPSKMFTFDDDPFSHSRPMTAPNPTTSNTSYSSMDNTMKSGVIIKKPFLKRKKRRKLSTKKVDWSHVKPKTISHLSEDVRASRNVNNHKSDYKPNAINWKERVCSRVDCGNKTSSNRKRLKQRRKQNSFRDTYHHSIQTQANCRKDDDYLYYLKKGNKIGKITKESATARLHDGTGPMILKPNSNKNESNNMEHEQYMDEFECDDSADNQLRELQQTFAAIEKAMKQRREKQQLQID